MPRSIPFVLCRYSLSEDGSSSDFGETFRLLKRLRGKRVAYRVSDPAPDDFNTYLIRPRQKDIDGEPVLTWEVAHDVTLRSRLIYDPDSDETSDELVPTQELKATRFVALPSLGVFAVDDRSGERYLGARSAVSRLEKIVHQFSSAELSVSFAGTPQDAERALETWSLDRFTFTVRPFNPTVRKPGEELHELLTRDKAGRLKGQITPDQAKSMRDSHNGIIAEARGLSDAGYGQFGAKGVTPSGHKASISEPPFDMNKERNLMRQAENRTLKIYIPTGGSLDEEDASVVKALREFYDE